MEHKRRKKGKRLVDLLVSMDYNELEIRKRKKDKYIDFIRDNPTHPKTRIYNIFLNRIGITNEMIQNDETYFDRKREKIVNTAEDDDFFSCLSSTMNNNVSRVDPFAQFFISDDDNDKSDSDCEEAIIVDDENDDIPLNNDKEDIPVLTDDLWVIEDNTTDISTSYNGEKKECKRCDCCAIEYKLCGKLQYSTISSGDIVDAYNKKSFNDAGLRTVVLGISQVSRIVSPHIVGSNEGIIQYEDIVKMFNKEIRWFENKKEVFFVSCTPPLNYYDNTLKYEEVYPYTGDLYPTFVFSNGETFAYDMSDIYCLPFTTYDYVYRYNNKWYCIDEACNGKTNFLLRRGDKYYLASDANSFSLCEKNKNNIKEKNISHNVLMRLITSYCEDNIFNYRDFIDTYRMYRSINFKCLRVLLNWCGIYYDTVSRKHIYYQFICSFDSCTTLRSRYALCNCITKYTGNNDNDGDKDKG